MFGLTIAYLPRWNRPKSYLGVKIFPCSSRVINAPTTSLGIVALAISERALRDLNFYPGFINTTYDYF